MDARASRRRQQGFTLTELAIATVVLLFGVVAVMQLVPKAMELNLNNRYDTTSTVIAQRLLDLMIAQGVAAPTLIDPTGTFPCGVVNPCQLGAAGVVGDVLQGSPLTIGAIDFTAARVPGYSFFYTDPNDPSGSPYDVRWAVVTSVRNVGPNVNITVAKRFIVGARRRNPNSPTSVTLTAWVSR